MLTLLEAYAALDGSLLRVVELAPTLLEIAPDSAEVGIAVLLSTTSVVDAGPTDVVGAPDGSEAEVSTDSALEYGDPAVLAEAEASKEEETWAASLLE